MHLCFNTLGWSLHLQASQGPHWTGSAGLAQCRMAACHRQSPDLRAETKTCTPQPTWTPPDPRLLLTCVHTHTPTHRPLPPSQGKSWAPCTAPATPGQGLAHRTLRTEVPGGYPEGQKAWASTQDIPQDQARHRAGVHPRDHPPMWATEGDTSRQQGSPACPAHTSSPVERTLCSE